MERFVLIASILIWFLVPTWLLYGPHVCNGWHTFFLNVSVLYPSTLGSYYDFQLPPKTLIFDP
jgi:hypothetical protein